MQYYNGFHYQITHPSRNRTVYAVEIFDNTKSTMIHREIRMNWSNSGAVAYARNWIDIHSNAVPGDIGDEPDDIPDIPITIPINTPPIDAPPEKPEPDDNEGVTYPHTMYDCETGKSYIARNFQMHHGMLAAGLVHDLSECNVPPPLEDDSNNIFGDAGMVVGSIARGTIKSFVPIISLSVAVGFMIRIVKVGVRVGS